MVELRILLTLATPPSTLSSEKYSVRVQYSHKRWRVISGTQCPCDLFDQFDQFKCNISFGFCRPDIGHIIMDKLKDELAKSTAQPVGKYLIKTTYQ